DNTLNSLSCWDLPSTNTNYITFDFIIQGFIPTALTAAITTVVNKKEVFSIINSVIGIAQTLFRGEIWSYRCDLFSELETNQGITSAIKRTSSTGIVRSCVTVNTLHSYSS